MTDIDDVADYIVLRLAAANECCNLLKLQKLLYYCQAWNLAFFNTPLFNGKFQAWVHGPVARRIYDRFSMEKSLYSQVGEADIRSAFNIKNIPDADKTHIDNVLEVYARYSGTQLEIMTHQEAPWQEARENVRPSERCEEEIKEESMRKYYAARLNN